MALFPSPPRKIKEKNLKFNIGILIVIHEFILLRYKSNIVFYGGITVQATTKMSTQNDNSGPNENGSIKYIYIYMIVFVSGARSCH